MSEVIYPKFRWYVLAAILVATLAQGMLLIAPTPLVGEIAKTLNADLGAATAAAMLPFTLFVAIGGITGGIVMDKIGLGKTFVGCFIICSVSAFLVPVFGNTIGGLAILRALQGFGCGPIIVSGPKLAAEWFPKNQRTLFQGLVGAALSLGITAGLISGPAIAKGVNWQVPIVWFGTGMVISFILFIIYAIGPKPPVNTKESFQGDNIADFRLVFKLPAFWFTLISVFALSWVQQGYNDLTPGHLAVSEPVGLNMGAQAAGSIMGIYTLAFMVGSLASGFVLEKIFCRKFKTAITTSFILTAIFCLSVLFPAVNKNISILIPCLLLAGFFMGMPNPLNMGFISSNYPENITGAVGGITMGLGIFGGTIAVAAGSFALHATGMYTVSIIIVVIVAIIGALAGFGVKPSEVFPKIKIIP